MRNVKLGQTLEADPVAAAEDFYQQVAQPGLCLVIFFCSSHYDLSALGAAMQRCFGDTPVVGCTTAGEIGPAGYRDRSLSGASLPKDGFSATIGQLHTVNATDISTVKSFAQNQAATHFGDERRPGDENDFALLLIDGVSQREETVTSALSHGLPDMPIVGGSAGDDLAFDQSWIYYAGQFHSNSAALILVSTVCPITACKSQHFAASDQRLVITEVDTEQRRVTEINGCPAAQEYARLTGVDVYDLNPMRFAAAPVVVLINGKEYVRSIQRANPDGSLTFYCAIEAGLVFRVAQGVDLLDQLAVSLADVNASIGSPQLLLAFDCVLRKLELEHGGDTHKAGAMLRAQNTVGFNSYGEQFGGVHVNQTFTCLAIGAYQEEI